MAKVYGIHEIELRPGADPAALEQLFAAGASLPSPEGWTFYLLKGERGERKGKYLVMVEIESLAARDRYQPDSGPTAEAQALDAHAADVWARWQQLATVPDGQDDVFTDYVVIQ